MVKKVASFILSLTVSAVGWVLAVRHDKSLSYQMPEFFRKRWRTRMGSQYEFLYKKLTEIRRLEITCNPIIISKLKLSLRLLDYRFRKTCEQNEVLDQTINHRQVDLWASYLGCYHYSLSFYEDLILNTFVLLSSDSKSKRELLCELLWREFFIFDGEKAELKHSKFLLPILEVFANLAMLPEGTQLIQRLGLLNWIKEQTESIIPSVALESWRLYQNMKSNSITYTNKVYPLIPPYLDEEPLVDIIFVHGIKGGASWTWRQHDSERYKPIINSSFRKIIFSTDEDLRNCVINQFYTWLWPLDWIKTSLMCPNRLIAINYPADWWKTSNIINIDYNLEELSNDLIEDLIAAGVGSRPIIWVTHSLGGLLLKNIFHIVSQAKEKKYSDLYGSTKGIVFYSVPHFGCPLSSWTYLFSYMFKPSSLLYCMTSEKPYLLKIHETFVKLCEENKIEILSINETKPASITSAGPKILFVSSESGNPGIGTFHAVDNSHLDVCKPVERNTPSYTIMQEFISKLLKCLYNK